MFRIVGIFETRIQCTIKEEEKKELFEFSYTITFSCVARVND